MNPDLITEREDQHAIYQAMIDIMSLNVRVNDLENEPVEEVADILDDIASVLEIVELLKYHHSLRLEGMSLQARVVRFINYTITDEMKLLMELNYPNVIERICNVNLLGDSYDRYY